MKRKVIKNNLNSRHLARKVTFDIYLPDDYSPNIAYKLLLINDGQDLSSLNIVDALDNSKNTSKLMAVGIYADENRLSEYGVAGFPDFKNRGDKAGLFTAFVMDELLPILHTKYNINPSQHAYCGFSLGGLMAFDIAMQNANVFSEIGAFSASFWWRSKAYYAGYNEQTDRIIHNKIRALTKTNEQRFWFENGTNDETEDRNQNGVIDAIDDTNDVIADLKTKGFIDISFKLVENGQHNYDTWASVFPEFLDWLV